LEEDGVDEAIHRTSGRIEGRDLPTVAHGFGALRLEDTLHILLFLLFGLVVGAVARFLVPGREPGGWVVSMVLGIGGALLGGYFGRVLGLYREGQPAGFVMALLGAIVLVVVYQALAMRRSRLG
jgi:uncharacterized membrane protein YeaQ/YmgE (transglycosylase-associated protein family)